MKRIKISAKIWTLAIAGASWLVTQPAVLAAVDKFSKQHHWAVALGTLLTLIGHLFYEPTKGA